MNTKFLTWKEWGIQIWAIFLLNSQWISFVRKWSSCKFNLSHEDIFREKWNLRTYRSFKSLAQIIVSLFLSIFWELYNDVIWQILSFHELKLLLSSVENFLRFFVLSSQVLNFHLSHHLNILFKFVNFESFFFFLSKNGWTSHGMSKVDWSSSTNQHVNLLWVNVCKDHLFFRFYIWQFDIEYKKFIVQTEARMEETAIC